MIPVPQLIVDSGKKNMPAVEGIKKNFLKTGPVNQKENRHETSNGTGDFPIHAKG